MASSLERVWRIRATLEEMARRELEAEVGRMRALEGLAAEAAGEALASRERWFAAVEREFAAEGEQGEYSRAAEESVWELAVWRRGRAESGRRVQLAEVDRARGGFLNGRRERLQVEGLVEAAKNHKRLDDRRAEQRLLDDWYQSQPGGGASNETESDQAVTEEDRPPKPPF